MTTTTNADVLDRAHNEIWQFTLVQGDAPTAPPLWAEWIELPQWLLQRDYDRHQMQGYHLHEQLLRAWVMAQTADNEIGAKHRRFFRRAFPEAIKTGDKALVALRWANGPRAYKHKNPPLRAEDGTAWRIARGLYVGTYASIRKHEAGVPAGAFDAVRLGRALDIGAKRALHARGIMI